MAQFAVNLNVHRTSRRLERDLEICVRYKVPIIITSWGAREDVNLAAHSYGGITLRDVINLRHAHKAIEEGADGPIVVAAGAGGHTGAHGNYLKPTIRSHGFDPGNLEVSDSSKMNFAAGTSRPKQWKDIWGAGHGIGAIKAVVPVVEFIDRLEREYLTARERMKLS